MAEINIFKHASDALTLDSGEVLFREGDTGDDMFAVVEGAVELSRNETTIEVVGAGGILGELALVDPGPRSATARAQEPSRVVRVDHRQFTFLVQEHPTFALQVMAVMAERLRRTNENADR